MKNLFLGALLAAIALFFWGFLFYGATTLPYQTLSRTTTDIGPQLNALFPADGIYMVPAPTDANATELTARGPVATVTIHKAGAPAADPKIMVAGFFHGFLYALVLGLILRKVRPVGGDGIGCRIMLCTMIGVAVAIMARVGDAIWFQQPWGWQLVNALYAVTASLVAGLVLGKFIQPEPAAD